MRIECDYCLAVYESETSENEQPATCPFCASRPDRTTARQFQAAPARPRVNTAPFGAPFEREAEPVRPARASIVCPPASRSLDEPVRRGAETPAYVRVAERVDPDEPREPPAELPGIDPPVASRSERNRPAYDWPLPVPEPPSRSTDDAPRVADIPRVARLPHIADDHGPVGDTERPFSRSDQSPPELRSRRSRAAVWVPFVLGAAGAAFFMRGMFTPSADKSENKESPGPTSVASHLAAVDQGVSVGDIEQAVAALDRATRVAPRDPAVLVARAKVAVERADVAWLVRKASPAAPADGPNYEDFVRAAGEARSAADEALHAMPDNDEARRAAINALRIFGEVDRAREIAAALRDTKSADSVYALAALDLTASNVPPESPVARLRQNTWTGGFPGKARATLVYALVRAGDVDGARVELDKLALLARPHPAATALRALVDGSPRAIVKPTSVAPAPRRDRSFSAKVCSEASKATPHDARSIIREAVNAKCHGDLTAARKLYQSLLDVTPNDAEALSGMGDLSRQEDNWDAARNFYAEALRSNPAFLPAAIGAADVEWDVGNLPVAQRKYREIIEAFPNGAYPPRVGERAAPPARGSKSG